MREQGGIMKQLPAEMQKNMKNTKSNGTIFKDPITPKGNNVRVERGNPNSPNPAQQNPYVQEVRNGKPVDVKGREVKRKSF